MRVEEDASELHVLILGASGFATQPLAHTVVCMTAHPSTFFYFFFKTQRGRTTGSKLCSGNPIIASCRLSGAVRGVRCRLSGVSSTPSPSLSNPADHRHNSRRAGAVSSHPCFYLCTADSAREPTGRCTLIHGAVLQHRPRVHNLLVTAVRAVGEAVAHDALLAAGECSCWGARATADRREARAGEPTGVPELMAG